MNKKLIVFGLVILAVFGACGKSKAPEMVEQKMDHSSMTMAEVDKGQVNPDERVIYYTCPMKSHKHVHSAEPGKCEECGMALVAGVVTSEEHKEFYGCPMEVHSHVRSDKPGVCEDCGMKLKPMRLVKS